MTLDIREDFAGPGGWSQALHNLGHGHRALGHEYDPKSKAAAQPAVATARAAGHQRTQEDVRYVVWAGPLVGYVASPPCQPFSAAGKGEGRRHLLALIEAAHRVAAGDTVKAALYACGDPDLDERSELVLHPLTVIRDQRPEWVALEQVPTVQPIWEAYALILAAWGYHVATGLLSAEMYGVPQTRKRAVLIAHRGRPVHLPTPTHSRYYSRDKARLDPGVLPWVSMATALGWGLSASPSPTITGGGTETGGAEPIAHLSRYPSRPDWVMGDLRTSKGTIRRGDEPAPTLTGALDNGNYRFAQRSNYKSGDDPDARGIRELDDPSATITGRPPQWTYDRPSTTIVGSFRPEIVAAPGYRTTVSRQNAPDSVRVTVQEAGILQSFPPDYPWQGTKSQQYQQVGNAIPPLLAQAILGVLL